MLLGLSRACGSELDQARDALDRDQNEVAISIAEAALRRNSSSAEAWIILGHGLSAEAETASPLHKLSLARRCLDAYRRAASLAPTNVEAHAALLEFYFRAPAIAGGSRNLAWKEQHILETLDLPLAKSWAIALYIDAQKLTDAEATAAELTTLEPESFRSWYWRARVAAVRGKFHEAALAYRRAMNFKPGPRDADLDEVQEELGDVLMDNKEYDEALSAYRAALDRNPKNLSARSKLATAESARRAK